MTNRVYSFIGLAMKAGKLVSGDESCERTIRGGKAYLVIVTEDATDNTAKKFKDACLYRKVPYFRFGEKETLGRLLGKELRSVVTVTDLHFAKKLTELVLIEQSNEKKHGGGLIE